MQFIMDAIKANTDEDGKIDLEKVEAAIKAEFPKNAVPKDQYNTVAGNLKNANDTLAKLQDENKDVKSLQEQIDEYKKQVDEKDKELVKTRNESTLREALREAGANDIDYLVYKLGELETDADGNYKDVDNKVKSLKDSEPKWFGSEDDDKGDGKQKESDGKGGWKPVDNKLPTGQPPKGDEPKTLADAIAAHYNPKK